MEAIVIALLFQNEDKISEILEMIRNNRVLKDHIHIIKANPRLKILKYNTSQLVVRDLPIFLVKESPDSPPYTVPILEYKKIFSMVSIKYKDAVPSIMDCQKSQASELSIFEGDILELRSNCRGTHHIYELGNKVPSFQMHYSHLVSLKEMGNYHFVCETHKGELEVKLRKREHLFKEI